jgi:hypothetical protein
LIGDRRDVTPFKLYPRYYPLADPHLETVASSSAV